MGNIITCLLTDGNDPGEQEKFMTKKKYINLTNINWRENMQCLVLYVNRAKDPGLHFKHFSSAVYSHLVNLGFFLGYHLFGTLDGIRTFLFIPFAPLCFHFVSCCLKMLLFIRGRITGHNTGTGSISLLELASHTGEFLTRLVAIWASYDLGFGSPIKPDEVYLSERVFFPVLCLLAVWIIGFAFRGQTSGWVHKIWSAQCCSSTNCCHLLQGCLSLNLPGKNSFLEHTLIIFLILTFTFRNDITSPRMIQAFQCPLWETFEMDKIVHWRKILEKEENKIT